MNGTMTVFWEILERRLHLCAEHMSGAALTPQFVEYLNGLPMNSPAPFDFAQDVARVSNPWSEPDAHGLQTRATDGPESAPFTTILNNGPTANRIDLVLVGDGYTEANLPTYNVHAQNMVNGFFNELPLNIYKPLFNVHRVDVVSNESGVDNDPVQGIMRDTAMDMYFWCSGIERLLCVNTTKALNFAASAPQADQVIAIANSTKYGGAGGSVATFSGGNSSALEVALHEVGHSFAGLADEYDYGDGVTYTGGERPEPNVSIRTAAQMQAQQTKWWRWLDLPEVDTFEGAYYAQFGIYRPTINSKMRSLFRPWDAVNTEQWVINIYERVRPIDSATPPGIHPSTLTFNVDPIDPVGNPLSIQWLVDGVPVPGATGTSFNAISLDLSGNHTLTVQVVDNTPLVRDPAARATWLTQTRSWTMRDAIPPRVTASTFDVDQPDMQTRLVFNEDVGASLNVADLVLQNLTTGTTVPAENLSLNYSTATRTATFTFSGYPQGILPDGNYRATLPAGSVTDAGGNALAGDFALDFFFVQADASRDGIVNLTDFDILAANFGQSPRVFTDGDFNYDSIVNLLDFDILASRFGQGPAPSVANWSSSDRTIFGTTSILSRYNEHLNSPGLTEDEDVRLELPIA